MVFPVFNFGVDLETRCGAKIAQSCRDVAVYAGYTSLAQITGRLFCDQDRNSFALVSKS